MVKKKFSKKQKKDVKKNYSEASLVSQFKQMNKKFYFRDRLEPERSYQGYLLSKNWFENWINNTQDPILQEIVNIDLIHSNPYNFKTQNFLSDKEILINLLEIDINYILVTYEAWKVIEENYATIPIFKTFYLDFNFSFIDADKNFAVNLIFLKENEMVKKLVHVQYPESLSQFLKTVMGNTYSEKILDQCYLADTRIKLEELEKELNKDIILGKKILLDKDFSFFSIKTQDIIIINESRQMDVQQKIIKEGYCYYCHQLAQLIFDCKCQIVGYCCLDCKYEDYYIHGSTCKPVEFPEHDFEKQIQILRKNELQNGVLGLYNVGNSCYLNSLMQILKFQMETDQLIKYKAEDCTKAIELSFLWFLNELWFNPKTSQPWFFKIYLGLINQNYLYFMQNDAHECLMTIIDELQQTGLFGKAFAEIFTGKSVNQIKCKNCRHKIEKEEKFYVLSLPLTQAKAKWKIQFYKLISKEILSFENVQCTYSMDTLQDSLQDLLDNQKIDHGVLYLSNKHGVIDMVDKESSLEKIFKEKQNFANESAEFYLLSAELPMKFMGLTFIAQQVSKNGVKIKEKLFNARLVPLTIKEEISNREVYRQIYQVLQKNDLFKGLNLPVDLTDDFVDCYLAFINDENFFMKKFSEDQKTIKGLKYKLFTQEDFENSYEKERLVQQLWQEEKEFEEQNLFEIFQTKYEVQINMYGNKLIKQEELEEQDNWCVMFNNRNDKCQNCGQNGNHVCKLILSDKKLKVENFLNFQIVFGSKISIPKVFIDQISLEKQFPKENEIQHKKNSYHLQNCFEGFFQKEEIEYKCEKCENRDSTMNAIIKEYPQVLVFHLKRFKTVFKFNSIVYEKDEKLVEYEKQMSIEGKTYDLVGVINHKGEMGYGHYTSFALNNKDRDWYFFNDSEVTKNDNIQSPENYVLFYKLI